MIETMAGQQGYYHNGEYLYRNPPIRSRYIKVYKLNLPYKKQYLRLIFDHEDNKGIAKLIFSFGRRPGIGSKYAAIYNRFYEPKSTIDLIKFCIKLFTSNQLI